jgi:hypothetical protein
MIERAKKLMTKSPEDILDEISGTDITVDKNNKVINTDNFKELAGKGKALLK